MQHDGQDKRRRMILLIEVQRLAELHGISLASSEHVTQEKQSSDEVLHRLDAIEQKLDILVTQVRHLEDMLRTFAQETHQIPVPSQQSPLASVPPLKRASGLPEGTLSLLDFANAHGVNRRTLLGQLHEHGLPHLALPSNRAGEQKRYLTPVQQRGVILFWQRNGTPYQECATCPH